jgi:hypothetical protein
MLVRISPFWLFIRLWHKSPKPEGPRNYAQMSVTAEAHQAIVEMGQRMDLSIIDTVDVITGVSK